MRREGTETRLGSSRGRARCAGESDRPRIRGLPPASIRAADRLSFCTHVLTIHISFDLHVVYIYISAYMPSCLYRTQSRQIRTFALAYRSLNQVKPGVSQGLRASVPRDLLPNIRRNANFTSVCVFNSFTQTPGYVESCSGQSHQIHLFPDLVPSAPNLLDTQ